MQLSTISQNIKNISLESDIYSKKCNCGLPLTLDKLKFGKFGTSLVCNCGYEFFYSETNANEILIYEEYDFIKDNNFTIVKQKVFAPIDWKNKKLLRNGLRESNEYLQIDFKNKKLIHKNHYKKIITSNENLFFKNINLSDMKKISSKLENFCFENEIKPNYGSLLKNFNDIYNTPNYLEVLKEVLNNTLVESFVKENLIYLFSPNFLLRLSILQKKLALNTKGTTCASILGVPEEIVNYIVDNKFEIQDILEIQDFFKAYSYNDFYNTILNENTLFNFSDLNDVTLFLNYGYSSEKLDSYAKKIMKKETWNKNEFLYHLASSIRMNTSVNLKFDLYSENLKQIHATIKASYKPTEAEILLDKILKR